MRLPVKRLSLLAVAVVAGTVVVAAALAAGPPRDAKYVGSDQCKMCHLAEHRSWLKTKHAANFQTLKGDEQKDPDCLKCHTTGYGQPGGFTTLAATPKLINVGCEECHGPGSAHVAASKSAPDSGAWDKKINKVPQNVCIKCHNTHVNQKERVAKIRAGK